MERKIRTLIKEYEQLLKLLKSTLKINQGAASARGQIYALENVIEDLQSLLRA